MNKPGQTTWKQIPISIKMACGAREAMLTDDNTVRFKVGGKPMHYVSVAYCPGSDLYNIESYRIKLGGHERVVLKTVEGVYVDSMGEVIYSMVHKN